MYEMAREVNSRNYPTVEPAASAPAQSTNAMQLADNLSVRDITLVDNDLYRPK